MRVIKRRQFQETLTDIWMIQVVGWIYVPSWSIVYGLFRSLLAESLKLFVLKISSGVQRSFQGSRHKIGNENFKIVFVIHIGEKLAIKNYNALYTNVCITLIILVRITSVNLLCKPRAERIASATIIPMLTVVGALGQPCHVYYYCMLSYNPLLG